MEQVILVDEADREMGVMEKHAAHRGCTRHRAFSVFVQDPQGRLLLQRRHPGKYHSGGLWTNACDGHPRPGEDLVAAARRRLAEEMGFDCPLHPLFAFTYEADLGEGLMECEYDHVLLGRCAALVRPDLREVSEWTWVAPEELRRAVAERPGEYAVWFLAALPRVLEALGGASSA